MLRFWAHHSTKAKEQHQVYDYYFNHAGGRSAPPPANGAGRVGGLLAVPGQVVKKLVGLVRRVLR